MDKLDPITKYPNMVFPLVMVFVIGFLLLGLAVQTVYLFESHQAQQVSSGGEFELLDTSDYSPSDADVSVMVGEAYFIQEDSSLPDNVVEASVGDIVYFYNEGEIAHTVTLAEFGIDEFVNPRDEVYIRVNRPVEETVLDCTLHSHHEGVLTVRES